MATKGRVQVEDPLRQAPELKVRPLAPDVFVGAPSVSGAGRPLADIADALSGFAGNVDGLSNVMAAAEKERQQQATKAFADLPRQMQIDAVNSGYNPDGTKMTRVPAVSKIYGEDHAANVVDELKTDLQTGKFDYLSDQPVDQYIYQRAAKVRQTLGGDRFAQAGFDGRLKQFSDEQMVYQSTLKAKDAENKGKDAYFLGLGQTLQKSKDAGITDVDGQYDQLMKTRDLLQNGSGATRIQISKQDFDDQTFAFAKSIVKDNPELAVKIISDPRKGIGAIGYKRENLEQSQAIAKEALQVINKRETDSVRTKLAQAALTKGLAGANLGAFGTEGTLTDASGNPLKHADGTPIQISNEDLKNELMTQYKLYSGQEANRLKESPDQTTDREVFQLKRMGIVNPEWKALFKSFASGLTEDDMQNPQKMQEFQTVAHLYDQMRAQGPFVAQPYLDKETSDLMDRYWVARNRLGVTAQDQALSMALAGSDPQSDQKFLSAEKAVKDKVAREYDNGSDYARQLRETATGYVRMGGISPDKAVDLAKERMNGTGVSVNGSYVQIPIDPKTNTPISTPDGFGHLAEVAIEKWADLHAPPGVKAGDLTLRGFDNGLYKIVDKRTGIPVMGINVGNASTAQPLLTARDFLDVQAEEQRKADLQSINDQHIDQKVRAFDYSGAIELMGGHPLNDNNSRGPRGAKPQVPAVDIVDFLNLVTRKSFWWNPTNPSSKELLGNPGGGPLGTKDQVNPLSPLKPLTKKSFWIDQKLHLTPKELLGNPGGGPLGTNKKK